MRYLARTGQGATAIVLEIALPSASAVAGMVAWPNVPSRLKSAADIFGWFVGRSTKSAKRFSPSAAKTADGRIVAHVPPE